MPQQQVLTLEGFLPHSVNQLVGGHWGQGAQAKGADMLRIRLECVAQGIERARGRRRLSVVFVQRMGRLADPDNRLKILLDGLVAAGVLIDDSQEWLQLGTVEVIRGPGKSTRCILEDIS